MTAESSAIPRWGEWSARQVMAATLVVLAVGLAFVLLIRERIVVFSLFEAIVISTAIGPAVDWLHRRGVPRATGVVVLYLLLMAVFVGFFILVLPLIVEQGATLAQLFGGMYQDALNVVRLSPSSLIRRLAWQLPGGLTVTPPAGAGGGAAPPLDAVARVLAYVGPVSHSLFVFSAVLLLAFYWTLERERIVRFLLLLVPLARRDDARDLFVAAEQKVGAYIRGVAILSAIIGLMAFAAYLVIGLPNALLLGLAGGLFEAVPVLGPALGVLPAVLVALAFSPEKAIWVLVAFGGLQFLENTIIAPRVMGRTVGVNPVVSLLALAGFSSLFGLPGALLAIPLAAVIQLLLDRYVLTPRSVEEEAPPGRDQFSVLRYEAQELVRDARKQQRDKPLDLDDKSDVVEDAIEALATDLDLLLAQRGPAVETAP